MAGTTEKQTKRPPIVTIMGHVDHGKTTLLDTIRQSRVAQSEHGGITQHIGAYQVEHDQQKITFIDTPGHAAFSEMRARGVRVTDIVVLVVAADDGVKPQTVESIKLIQQSHVPFVVAVNKVDLPQASAATVKAQLTEHQVFVEGYGGQTPVVEISAKKGEGIDHLLEMILLLYEMETVEASSDHSLAAVVIESKLDKKVGPTATVIVQDGSITQGEYVYVNQDRVKIRTMKNDLHQVVTTAIPGDPVQIYGFTTVPSVGMVLTHSPQKETKPEISKVTETVTEEAVTEKKMPTTLLKLIVKADTQGTLEAIIGSIMQEEIELIAQGVGAIGEADVLLAHTTGAEIIGFNVDTSVSAQKISELEQVQIHLFQVIYKLIEYIEEKVLRMIEPTMYEEEIGKAKIMAVFEIRGERIAGCLVESGKIEARLPIKLVRKEVVVGESTIKSMKQGKEEVKTGKAGKECGIVLTHPIDFRVGDVLKSYRMIQN